MAKQAVKKSRRRLKQNLVGWGFVLPAYCAWILVQPDRLYRAVERLPVHRTAELHQDVLRPVF